MTLNAHDYSVRYSCAYVEIWLIPVELCNTYFHTIIWLDLILNIIFCVCYPLKVLCFIYVEHDLFPIWIIEVHMRLTVVNAIRIVQNHFFHDASADFTQNFIIERKNNCQ